MLEGTELWVRLYRLLIVLIISWLIFEKSDLTTSYSEENFIFLFPEAVRIENDEVFDQDGRSFGYFLTTSPQCDHLKGYSGPTNLALALDKTGKLVEAKIIESSDTPDHVQSVVDDSNFWKAHLGLSLGSPGHPKIDAVTGSTLTSAAISRSIIERLGGLTTSRLFPTEILAAEIPEAETIKKHPDWPGVLCIYNEDLKIVGYALRTAPSQEYLHGYQGPTDILIVLDREAKKVTRIRFRKSYDNEEYYQRILENPDWLNLYNGMTIKEILAIDQVKIEGISGATHTSWAIADSVARRLARFESDRESPPREIPWRNIALVTLTMGATLFSFTRLRGNPWARVLWQIIVVVFLGIILGDLLSQALLLGWARHGLPFSDSWGLLFLAAAALLTPWATGHELYCHQLCPHGFLQRWLGKLPVKPIKLPAKLHKFLSTLPALFLLILVASTIIGASLNLADWEGFDAWLWRSAGFATITVAVAGLAASIFSPLAYCKFGCPTGALFKFLRKSSGAKHLSLRDLIAGLLCLAAFFF